MCKILAMLLSAISPLKEVPPVPVVIVTEWSYLEIKNKDAPIEDGELVFTDAHYWQSEQYAKSEAGILWAKAFRGELKPGIYWYPSAMQTVAPFGWNLKWDEFSNKYECIRD